MKEDNASLTHTKGDNIREIFICAGRRGILSDLTHSSSFVNIIRSECTFTI